MGVSDLMSPYVRDGKTATNTSIQTLLQNFPTKNRIGLDMSIIIVKSMRNKNATNIHNLYHSDPKVQLPDLTDKVIQEVEQFSSFKQQIVDEKGKATIKQVKAFDKIFCVFDGASHPLKELHAIAIRYSSLPEKKQRLEEIYRTKKKFESKLEENKILEEVKQLRVELMSFRPDILHDILKALREKFGSCDTISSFNFSSSACLTA